MRVLVACEYSGVVRDAFAARGFDAWSADLLPCEGGGNHFQGDVREILGDGWDLMIAHPPCTHLSNCGARWFKKKRSDGRQEAALAFFMDLARAPIWRKCLENPVGVVSRLWRKPDQIIQPYYFGDENQKTTCLWLEGLPPLVHSRETDLIYQKTHVGRGEMVTFGSGKRMAKWYAEAWHGGHLRSKTFQGIAEAMAEQWGEWLRARRPLTFGAGL